MPKITSVCAECGIAFDHPSSRTRVTCSRRCKIAAQIKRHKAEGRTWHPTKPRRGEHHPCATCGTPVYRNRSQIARGLRRFCSTACAGAGQRKPTIVTICAWCGSGTERKPSQDGFRYCGRVCYDAARILRPLDRMHNGRPARLDRQGYVLVWEPDHPNRSFKGWQYEHRLVVEVRIGRHLRSDEHVHHVNGVKGDNRPENLEVMGHAEHAALSAREYREQRARERAELEEYRRRFGPLKE